MSRVKCTASTFGWDCAATDEMKMRKAAAASSPKNKRERRIPELWHGDKGWRLRQCASFPYTRLRAGPLRTRRDRIDPPASRAFPPRRRGGRVRAGEAGGRAPARARGRVVLRRP